MSPVAPGVVNLMTNKITSPTTADLPSTEVITSAQSGHIENMKSRIAQSASQPVPQAQPQTSQAVKRRTDTDHTWESLERLSVCCNYNDEFSLLTKSVVIRDEVFLFCSLFSKKI